MTDAPRILLPVIDAAFDKAMLDPAVAVSGTAQEQGRHQGILLLRHRLGGQFLRNQGHFITSDQQEECVRQTIKHVQDRTDLPPGLSAGALSRSDDYWKGVEAGVRDYDTRLTAAAAPGAPASIPRRRRQP